MNFHICTNYRITQQQIQFDKKIKQINLSLHCLFLNNRCLVQDSVFSCKYRLHLCTGHRAFRCRSSGLRKKVRPKDWGSCR